MHFFTNLGRYATHIFSALLSPGFRSGGGAAFVPMLAGRKETQATPAVLLPSHVSQSYLFAEIFGLDVRSLALFRVCVALVVLADLAARSVDVFDHYTDIGILPRAIAISEYSAQGSLSLHLLGGSVLSQSILFSFAGLCAIGLLVGWRTRLMTIASWVLLVSLHNRNPMILDGGDVFLRMLLFWSIFLPLGAAYSLDSVVDRSPGRLKEQVVSIASVAFLLQVCFLYWFTTILKSDPVWRTEWSAVYYALNLDSFATPIGLWVREFSSLLPVLSFSTLVLEGLGPFLLFLPIAQGPIRFFTVCAFLSLHTGMGLCLALGIFPFIVGTAWLALLPTWFWHRLRVPVDLTLRRKFTLQQRLEQFLGRTRYRRLVTLARPPMWRPTVGVLFCAFCLIYVTLWNIRTVDFAKYSAIFPVEANWFGQTLRIDQMWGMFAPKPASDDGWYVIPARLRNGMEVDLMTHGGPVEWTKPVLVAETFRNQRWRKYLRNIWEREHAGHRLYFGQYLCRTWNMTHSDGAILETFQIYYVKEDTLPGGVIAPPEKVLIWSHHCF